MAKLADIASDLTLEMDGTGLTPERFQKGVRAFFGLVNEITGAVCKDTPLVKWHVKVKAGSSLIGLDPMPGFSADIISAIATTLKDGVSTLERGANPPAYFGDAAMKHLRDLGDVASGTELDTVRVRLWTKKEPSVVSANTVAHVKTVLAEDYEDHGSVDGRLQTVSERGGIRFVIYEILTDRGINCYIEESRLEDALTHFRKRVEAYGLIKYRKDGTPISIHVDEILPFPPPQELPDFRSVRGILRRAG